jgi:hypothetical protein
MTYSGVITVLGGIFAIRGIKKREKTPLQKGVTAIAAIFALSGLFYVASMTIAYLSPSSQSERYFNMDPDVKIALHVSSIDRNLPADSSALKEPWALVTVKLDKDGKIKSSDYADCSLGNFTGPEDVKKLRTIVFANAYKYDTVSYDEKVNGRFTGKSIKVDREAGTLYFYDMVEKRFVARYDTRPSSMVSSYNGVGKPSGSMSSRDFKLVVLSLCNNQNPDLYSTYIKTSEEEALP